MLAVIGVAWAFMNPRLLNADSMVKYWPARVIVALLVLACVGAPFGLSLGGSAMFILTDYVKVVVFAFLIIAAIRATEDLRWFVWAYIVSAAILVWMALFVFDISQASGSYASRLSHLYTYDANDLGCVLLAGLPLVLLGYQTARTSITKILAGLTVVGIGAAVARSGSRGAFLGLIAIALAMLVSLRHVATWKRASFVAVLSLGLFLAAPPGYWEQMNTITSPTEDYNWTSPYGRKAVARRGMELMEEFPVFGVGINNFARADATISERAENFTGGIGNALRWRAAHNSFVQAGAEMGVPGLLLWCSLIVGGVVGMVRLRRRLPERWRTGDAEQRFLYLTTMYMPVCFVGFAVTAFFVSFAYLDPLYLLAAYVTGVYACVSRRLRQEAIGRPRPEARPRPERRLSLLESAPLRGPRSRQGQRAGHDA